MNYSKAAFITQYISSLSNITVAATTINTNYYCFPKGSAYRSIRKYDYKYTSKLLDMFRRSFKKHLKIRLFNCNCNTTFSKCTIHLEWIIYIILQLSYIENLNISSLAQCDTNLWRLCVHLRNGPVCACVSACLRTCVKCACKREQCLYDNNVTFPSNVCSSNSAIPYLFLSQHFTVILLIHHISYYQCALLEKGRRPISCRLFSRRFGQI